MSRRLFPCLGLLVCAALSAPAEELDFVKMSQQWKASVARLDSQAGFSEFRAFYKENSPDLLEQWQRKNLAQEKLGALFLEDLARDFISLRRLKAADPREYRERLQILREEHALRDLGRRIVDLKRKNRMEENSPEIQALVKELQRRLLKSFDDSQQRQQLELLRLETEVRQLRKIVENRIQNKDFILRQRMEILCGQQK